MTTAVVMVARGSRTQGHFTTASDTTGSHWHLDNFSGNRRCGGERRRRGRVCNAPAPEQQRSPCVSSDSATLRAGQEVRRKGRIKAPVTFKINTLCVFNCAAAPLEYLYQRTQNTHTTHNNKHASPSTQHDTQQPRGNATTTFAFTQ